MSRLSNIWFYQVSAHKHPNLNIWTTSLCPTFSGSSTGEQVAEYLISDPDDVVIDSVFAREVEGGWEILSPISTTAQLVVAELPSGEKELISLIESLTARTSVRFYKHPRKTPAMVSSENMILISSSELSGVPTVQRPNKLQQVTLRPSEPLAISAQKLDVQQIQPLRFGSYVKPPVRDQTHREKEEIARLESELIILCNFSEDLAEVPENLSQINERNIREIPQTILTKLQRRLTEYIAEIKAEAEAARNAAVPKPKKQDDLGNCQRDSAQDQPAISSSQDKTYRDRVDEPLDTRVGGKHDIEKGAYSQNPRRASPSQEDYHFGAKLTYTQGKHQERDDSGPKPKWGSIRGAGQNKHLASDRATEANNYEKPWAKLVPKSGVSDPTRGAQAQVQEPDTSDKLMKPSAGKWARLTATSNKTNNSEGVISEEIRRATLFDTNQSVAPPDVLHSINKMVEQKKF